MFPNVGNKNEGDLVRNFDTLAIHLGLCVRNFVSVGRGLDLAGFEAKEDDLSQNKYEPNGDGFRSSGHAR